jgi:hypothetical protein
MISFYKMWPRTTIIDITLKNIFFGVPHLATFIFVCL